VSSASPHNLPLQLTSFVGREREIAEVERLLGTTRLLTLTGAGGSGKTRLASEVAARVWGDYTDGVWLVELAALADPALVPQAVATALGVREAPGRTFTEALVAYLRPRCLLLILDNCEHLVAACAQLAEALLRAVPGLRILATSREALGNSGETAWWVPSLRIPEAELQPRYTPDAKLDAGTSELLAHEAVRLFVERATTARTDFHLTDRNAPAVAEICRRLDGIPLAIELAAARVRVFSVAQIAARLDDRFRLLTGGRRTALPRHQTLRATVDWSYNLLAAPEQALLRRLSVFAGGWTFEAVEAVGAGEGIARYAVLDLLTSLVDKSIAIAEEQRGAVRYRLLETIRQYARDKLREADEAERTQGCHLDYFLRLAEAAEPELRGPSQLAWLDRLEADHDNLRAALEWGLVTDGEAALRVSGALAWFWWVRSYVDEGRRWLARALEAAPGPPAARLRALYGEGWLAHIQRDAPTARRRFEESLAIARELGDRWAEAWVLHHLGRVAYFANDAATARARGEESLAAAEASGDDGLIAWALHLLGLAAHIAADYAAAQAYYDRSLQIRQRLGYQEGISILHHLLGIAAFREGDLVQAHARYREALAINRDLGSPWHVLVLLADFSSLAAAQGQPERAVRLAGAAQAMSEWYQAPPIPLTEALLAEGLALARPALGEAGYAAAWAEGRALSLEQSIAEALAMEAAPPPISPARPAPTRLKAYPAGLTAAEVRVLRLLARGRSTKDIAGELVVTVSTVDRHITHIYDKIGARNRASAASFALKHGLV
jgi:non-specific serine/threonine protein kinase